MRKQLSVKALSVLLVLMVSMAGTIAAQALTIKGTVTDAQTKAPLPYVTIMAEGTAIGTQTDFDGKYKLSLPEGNYQIVFKLLSYKSVTKAVAASNVPDSLSFDWNIKMEPEGQNLGPVLVTSEKYGTTFEKLSVTVEMVPSSLIENKNTTSAEKAIEQAPGIAIVDNEPQVRGGSGFSSGLGSRVQLVIDDIPLLRGDAGRPVWGFVPIENVEQIEVLKGASSVLYGSSALNGAINIRTAYAKDKPETRVFAFTGMYSKPERRYATYWGNKDLNPMQFGMSFNHTRRIKNVDFVFGGNFFRDDGYVGPSYQANTTDTLNKGEYERRGRLNFGIKVKSKKVEGLFYGINANGMLSKNAQAFFWANSDTGLYRSYPGSVTNFNEALAYVDPYIQYFTKSGNKHYLRNRIFYSFNGADNNQTTKSIQLYNEYQHINKLKWVEGMTLTTGLTSIYTYSTGKVFSGTDGSQGSSYSYNLAAYVQFDKEFFKRLNISAGGRFEYFEINKMRQTKPVFRAGATYALTEGTFVRASFGQGFRFPSIGERYISTRSGGFGFFPNSELKSENSWNTELGVKQFFKIGNFKGVADVAAFWQEYQNYIEFNAGLWGNSPDFTQNIGFKFLNTGPARVTGIDFSISGTGEITKDLSVTLLAGYTYSHPIALAPDLKYAENSTMEYTYNRTSTDTTGNILKYRIEHLGKADIEFNYKFIMVGFSWRYYSFMRNIDKMFYDLEDANILLTGSKQYREVHNTGSNVFDIRAGVKIAKAFKVNFIVSNLFNKEYSLRPLTLEPTRLTTIQLSYKL